MLQKVSKNILSLPPSLSYFFFFSFLTTLHAACLVQRSGWTRDVDNFFQWLSAIPFAGGGFSDAAIAEGLSEALMVCNVEYLNFFYVLYGLRS